MSTTNPSDEPQSRLDRELNEILEQARNRPISFQDRVAQKRAAVENQKLTNMQRAQRFSGGPVRTAGRWLLRLPLVTALILALIAIWVAPQSALIGGILAVIAGLLVFAPYVMQRPSDDITYQKRWRGRTIDSSVPGRDRSPRSWVDAARHRMKR